MKISVFKYSFIAALSFLMLTGFTCSKHVPEKAPEEVTTEGSDSSSVPQDQMTDQTTSGDTTPAETN
jgi:hypothetical protein